MSTPAPATLFSQRAAQPRDTHTPQQIRTERMNSERWRMPISRIFAAVVLCLILFTNHKWQQGAAIDVSFEIAGFLLILTCAAGRIWSLLYIAGRKTSSLVDQGPYSLVRHPLYVSTALGTIGIGLASENLIALVGIVVITLVSYWPVVRAEERRLVAVHGDAYRDYQRRVPQLIPNFSNFSEPKELSVSPKVFRRGATEAIAMIAIYMGLQVIEGLHNQGVLPVLFRI